MLRQSLTCFNRSDDLPFPFLINHGEEMTYAGSSQGLTVIGALAVTVTGTPFS